MATFLGTGTSNPGDVYTLGKIGIGTSSPVAALEIAGGGSIKANGYVVVDNSGYLRPRLSSISAAACLSLFINSADGMFYFKDSSGQEYKLT